MRKREQFSAKRSRFILRLIIFVCVHEEEHFPKSVENGTSTAIRTICIWSITKFLFSSERLTRFLSFRWSGMSRLYQNIDISQIFLDAYFTGINLINFLFHEGKNFINDKCAILFDYIFKQFFYEKEFNVSLQFCFIEIKLITALFKLEFLIYWKLFILDHLIPTIWSILSFSILHVVSHTYAVRY